MSETAQNLAKQLRATADEFGSAMMPDTAALLHSAADALEAAGAACLAVSAIADGPEDGHIDLDTLVERLNAAIKSADTALEAMGLTALAAARGEGVGDA